MKRAPGMLQAICIIAIVLGALGSFSVLGGVVGPFVNEAIQKMVAANMRPGSPQAKQQAQQQREIQAVADKWAPVNYALLAVLVVVVGCLIVGGVKAFRLQPSGHRLLLMAFLITIAFELMRLVPTISILVDTFDVMEQSMADSMKANSGGRPIPPAAARMSKTIMKGSIYLGIAFAVGWVLLKVGFYGFGAYYMRKPHIRGLYEPAAEIDWNDDAADAEEQTVPEDEPNA
jgi:hypothetical protein